MADDDLQQDSRSAHFDAGASGSGAGTTIASSLPRVAQVNPAFDASGSVLDAANRFSGVGNGSSSSTMRISDPYGQSMRDQLKSSGSGTPPEGG
jgi:hypothetical protein